MRRKSIQRNVVLIFFILAVGGMLFAGWYAWTTLDKMLGSVDRLAQPNPKQELLQSINANLSRVNQVYRSVSLDQAPPAAAAHQHLLAQIKRDIDSLQVLNRQDGQEMQGLDSMLVLLHKTEQGTRELLLARLKSNQQSLPAKLIKQLSRQINTLREKESPYIVKNTSSEIRIDKTLQALDSLSRLAVIDEKEKAGLFQKISLLFQKKGKKEQPAEQKMVLVPQTQADTLTTVSVDSVNTVSNEDLILPLQEFLQKLYEAEIKSIRQLGHLEKSIQAQNADLLQTIEELLLEIQAQDRKQNQQARQEAYVASGRFNTTLSLLILFFVGVGLLLLLLLLRDISQTGYYQRQLELEKEKANREAKAKQDFLATMSHEIRSPLTSIIGYADLLDGGQEHHQAIKKSSDHLLHLANEILDLAKIESGIIEMQAEPVNLPQLLQDLKQSFILKIKARGLKGIFELPEEDNLFVLTDPYRLNQVLYNLLHNAVKFTEKGHVHVEARVQLLAGERVQLTVQVKDTGIGIRQSDQKRIFEAYQQAGPTPYRREGSGLGLGIVRKVVTLLGGTIGLKSKLGQGSVFTVTIPFARAIPPAPAPHLHQEPTLLAGKLILVVDDDPLIGRLLKLILSGYGAWVEAFTHPQEALERMAGTRFDLAIFDLQMPELTGLELLERVRELPHPPGKILAATANVLLSGPDLQRLHQFDDLLYKPIQKEGLIRMISRHLNLQPTLLAPPAPAAIPVPVQITSAGRISYDLTALRKLTMGDPGLLQDILRDLYAQNKKELCLARTYLKNAQPLLLAEVVHKLASRFGQIGATRPFGLASQIERALRSGKLVKEAYALVEEWEQVNEQVKAENLQPV